MSALAPLAPVAIAFGLTILAGSALVYLYGLIERRCSRGRAR